MGANERILCLLGTSRSGNGGFAVLNVRERTVFGELCLELSQILSRRFSRELRVALACDETSPGGEFEPPGIPNPVCLHLEALRIPFSVRFSIDLLEALGVGAEEEHGLYHIRTMLEEEPFFSESNVWLRNAAVSYAEGSSRILLRAFVGDRTGQLELQLDRRLMKELRARSRVRAPVLSRIRTCWCLEASGELSSMLGAANDLHGKRLPVSQLSLQFRLLPASVRGDARVRLRPVVEPASNAIVFQVESIFARSEENARN